MPRAGWSRLGLWGGDGSNMGFDDLYADDDLDGMADAWEAVHGVDDPAAWLDREFGILAEQTGSTPEYATFLAQRDGARAGMLLDLCYGAVAWREISRL